MNLRKQLIQRLALLGVEDKPLAGRDDGFSSLIYEGQEFAHFHGNNELDMRLTRAQAIAHRKNLVQPFESSRHPKRSKNSPWIEIQFQTAADLERVIELVKMGIGSVEV